VLGYNLLIIAVLLGLRVVVTVLRPRAQCRDRQH
jgi:ubiquinone biosynthesis protein